MGRKREISRLIVEESPKTLKARKKLQSKIEAIEKHVTQEALEQKTQEIARWIGRHAGERVAVEKEIALFDRNKNSAKLSKGVAKMQEGLEETLKGS